MAFWNFFIKNKKNETTGLEKARQLDLITELELLKLKKDRAEKDLNDFMVKESNNKRKK
jgi:hypothetical protein